MGKWRRFAMQLRRVIGYLSAVRYAEFIDTDVPAHFTWQIH